MERVQYAKGFEKALRQCQETIQNFEGSQETLRHIRRIEESLKTLIAQTN